MDGWHWLVKWNFSKSFSLPSIFPNDLICPLNRLPLSCFLLEAKIFSLLVHSESCNQNMLDLGKKTFWSLFVFLFSLIMVGGKGKYDSNTNLVDAMEPTDLDDEKGTKPKFHKSSSMAKQSSIVGTRVQLHSRKLFFSLSMLLISVLVKYGSLALIKVSLKTDYKGKD